MHNRFFVLILLLPIWAVQADEPPLFTSKDAFSAVMTAPFTQVYKEKRGEVRPYREGFFAYRPDADAATQRVSVKIRTRGNFRRAQCSYPPLKLNFSKKNNKGTFLHSQNHLKLVGPCRIGKSYQELVLQEYVAYQLFEAISYYHFKTRLLDLNYVDSQKGGKPRAARTFLIEDLKHMAKRTGHKASGFTQPSKKQMDLEQTALVEIFQLMISNHDYSTLRGAAPEECCHNVRLIENEAGGKLIPVPYDFDSSGWVDAPYADPPAIYPVRSVRERYFGGWCKAPVYFENAIQRIRERKAQLYEIASNPELLNERSIRLNRNFLDSFFELIDDPKNRQSKIIERCRGKQVAG